MSVEWFVPDGGANAATRRRVLKDQRHDQVEGGSVCPCAVSSRQSTSVSHRRDMAPIRGLRTRLSRHESTSHFVLAAQRL